MSQVKIWLPKNTHGFKTGQDHLEEALIAAWGGYTAYEAWGAWEDEGGDVVEEPVYVYEVYTETGDVYSRVRAICESILRFTSEDCVMASVDGEKILVERDDLV